MIRRVVSLAVILFIVLFGRFLNSAQAEPYCGIYSVYGGARALGCANVPLEELVDEKFVTSGAGSSTTDLVRAADHLGIDATPMSLLGVRSLRGSQSPLILHCSPRGLAGSYHHWMLYLGTDEHGKARVVDGAGGVVACSMEEVLARWDGVAIALRDRSDARATTFLSNELSAAFLIVAGAFLAVGLIEQISSSLFGRSKRLLQLALAVMLAVVVGNCWVGNSYTSVASGIDVALGHTEIPDIGIEELVDLSCKSRVAVIDCRYQYDFELGHLDGATNVPVDSGMGTFRKLVKHLDPKEMLVIYCQSPECGFSDHSGAMFAACGFENIAILQPGYVGWVKYQRDRRLASTSHGS